MAPQENARVRSPQRRFLTSLERLSDLCSSKVTRTPRLQGALTPMTEPKLNPPVLTKEQILAALKRAAPGANELNRRLDEVFRLTPEQMNLILR